MMRKSELSMVSRSEKSGKKKKEEGKMSEGDSVRLPETPLGNDPPI